MGLNSWDLLSRSDRKVQRIGKIAIYEINR
jgi:hypothetical protein